MSVIDTAPVIPDLPIYRLTVDQYHEIIRSGALNSDDRVELLNGWMVPKVSNNPKHSVATELTVEVLRANVSGDFSVRSEKPITLSDSEPEPDAAVVKGSPRSYVDRHPLPDEIELVVEVADSSLMQDRRTKSRIYAAAGIRCYWIVDLVNRSVDVYTDSDGTEYLKCEIVKGFLALRIGDQPSVEIAVASLLP